VRADFVPTLNERDLDDPCAAAGEAPAALTRASDAIHERLAPIYDMVYGLALQPGRRRALQRLAPRTGESILEIGVGTGLSAARYPAGCRVVAIDLSAPMLVRAKTRLAGRSDRSVSLCRMDAVQLGFADGEFDAVYAPYLINAVDQPVPVAREMLRVCRPGGRLVFLNHFRDHRADGLVDRIVGHVAVKVSGVNWDLELRDFLREAGLTAVSAERVNVPAVSSVVVCHKPR
jgi:phosphatidylethanolamine/phosphatidyl-N-methylethanolamine N-methyltransferase